RRFRRGLGPARSGPSCSTAILGNRQATDSSSSPGGTRDARRMVMMLPLRKLVTLFLPVACGCGERAQAPLARATQSEPPLPPLKHPAVIHETPKRTSIETHETDATGRPLRVSCVTCHTLRGRSPLPTQASSLRQFHEGLTLEHGSLGCASCHDPEHPRSLHLADGTSTTMTSVMRLCSQ